MQVKAFKKETMKKQGFVIAKTAYKIDAIHTSYLVQDKLGNRWASPEDISCWTVYADPVSALMVLKALYNNHYTHPAINEVLLICRYPGIGEELIGVVESFTYRDDPNCTET
jgi:hypothetical protein